MSAHIRSFTGKAMYNGWILRKRLTETERPRLVKVLAGLAAVSGAFMIAEGIIAGWFLPHVTPYRWDLKFIYGRFPWIRFPQWLAASLMIVIGLMGLSAAMSLARRRRTGAHFTIVLAAALMAGGAVLAYSGIEYHSAWLTAAGFINIGSGLLLLITLGLGWYTIDPLGLHWSKAS